ARAAPPRPFEPAPLRSPVHGEAFAGLAEAQRALGCLEEARAAYGEAVRLSPRDAHPLRQQGERLRDMGDVEGALKRQREAVELDPESAAYWNSLGMTLGGNG